MLQNSESSPSAQTIPISDSGNWLLVGASVSGEVPEEPREIKKSLYNRLASWVVLVGVALLLPFFLPFTTSFLEFNKQLFLVAFSGIALVLWLVGIVSSGYLKWRPNKFLMPIGAVVLATVLATIFSSTKFKSIYGLNSSLSDSLVIIAALSVLYLLIVNIFDDKGQKLQLFLMISLGVVFVHAILQLFGVYLFKFPFAQSKFFNTLGSPNSLGILAAVSLPFLHKFRWPDHPRIGSYLSKVFLASAIFILFVLNWWVLWVVAIAGMFALIATGSLNAKSFRIFDYRVPLIVIILGVFLMAVSFDIPVLKKNLPVEIAPSHTLSSKIAISLLKDKLIFGYGPENFSIAFDKYGSSALSDTSLSNLKFYDASSEFFNFLVHGGVILVAALFYLLAVVTWEIVKRYASQSIRDGAVNGLLSMMLALVVAFFMYPFNLGLMFMFYLSLAMVALVFWGGDQKYYSIEKSPLLSLISSLGFIGGLVLVLVACYFNVLSYIADMKYAQAFEQKDSQLKANILTEAVKWSNKDDRYYRSLSQVSLELLSKEIEKPKDNPQRGSNVQNYIASAVNFARRAVDVGPNESLNWSNLGNVYTNLFGLVENVEKLAEESYLKASELRPGDANYHGQIGTLYMTKGDILKRLAASGSQNSVKANEEVAAAYKKSEEAFKKAIEISNNFGQAIYNLGGVYDRQGRVGEAVKQLEKLASANNNQPGLMFELGLLYYRANRKNDAFNQLERAILLAPEYSNARWYLALLYEERNELSAAIEQLEKILSIEANKNNKEVANKLEQLRSGKRSTPPDVLGHRPL